jgi:hypothetical protein
MNITNYITDCIISKTPVSFSKYGDGEYYCAIGGIQHNCDLDSCTDKLRVSLIDSIKYVVNETDNSYIGLWDSGSNIKFWESKVNRPIKWVDYHSIIITHHDFNNENNDILTNKVCLYKTIKQSNLKKIIICNPLLVRSIKLLNIDHMINIPLRNWFDTHFDELINNTCSIINNNEPFILITCCGMAAKIVISEMIKRFPNGIYLDFGSAIDLICTKRNSRGWNYTYEKFVEIFKDLLPDDWEDEMFNEVYEQAKINMGVHLPKISL